jgi:hypothetical protein
MDIKNKHFNLLRYWHVNCHRFPVLSTLAKRFLAVPVSNVSLEQTFNSAGRVLDDYRSSLKPAIVQALVCAASWIRATYEDKNKPLVVWTHHSNMCHYCVQLFLSCRHANIFLFYFQVGVGDDEDDVEFIEFPNCIVASN